MKPRGFRLVALTAIAWTALVAVAGVAHADIVYDDRSQDVFGVSASGGAGSSPTDAVFGEAWEIFANSVEGARILGKLDSTRNIEITVEVKPQDDIEYHDPVTGERVPVTGLMTPWRPPADGGPQEFTIEIAFEDRTAAAIAQTLYHEFRHVEHYLDDPNSDEGHDAIHAYTDDRFVVFLGQIGTAIPDDDHDHGDDEHDGSETPIYDSLIADPSDDSVFFQQTRALGNVLELDEPLSGPTVVPAYVQQTEFLIVESIDDDLADALGQAIEGLAPIDSDDRCIGDGHTSACGARSGFGAEPGDTLIGSRFGDDLPTSSDVADLDVFVALDRDRDETNNRGARSVNDPYQGADSWFQMNFDAASGLWRFSAWAVTASGGADIDRDTGAFGILQNDWMWFLVPADELPAEYPLFRTGIVADLDGTEVVDVNGELPSDPLTSFSGARYFGPPVDVIPTPANVIVTFGPSSVPSGGELATSYCLFGSDGSPQAGLDVATTLGNDPGGLLASHASGTTNELGCVEMGLPVLEPPGSTQLWFFDSVDVHPVQTIVLVEASLVEAEDP